MKNKNIAIQGIKGSYHEEAAIKLFGDNGHAIIECHTFPQLCETLQRGEADIAVMAIENTLAGSILPNYNLIERYGFKVQGEVYLRIEINLMALKGQSIDRIKYVKSHPMALHQSAEFFIRHPHLHLEESNDTALSARWISVNNQREYAALASERAAHLYNLKIIKKGIETNKLNYTRFLILSQEPNDVHKKHNKACVRFTTFHGKGRLAHILNIIADHDINLSKLQSVPVIGKPYQYAFHADLEWEDDTIYRNALKVLEKEAIEWTYLGEFQKAEKP